MLTPDRFPVMAIAQPSSRAFLVSFSLSLALVLGPTHVVACRSGSRGRGTAHAKETGFVLATVPVAPSGQAAYELSLERCPRDECPYVVRLVEGGRVHGSSPLEWGAAPRQPSRHPLDDGAGVGDALKREKGLHEWRVGDYGTATVARPVRLSPTLTGLLVHQAAGFEHLKRRHYLFVSRGSSLIEAWTENDGAGETISYVDVFSANDDRDVIRFWRVTTRPDREVDEWEVTTFRWSEKRARLERIPHAELTFPIFAVVVGPFASVANAREARTASDGCLSNFFVLERTPLGEMIVLAALTSHKASADAALADAQACAPPLKGRVERWSRTKLQQAGPAEPH